MFDKIIQQLAAMQAADSGALGAVLAIVIEGLMFGRDAYDSFKDDYDALKKRVAALEEKASVPPPIMLTLSAFQKAIRAQISNANVAVQSAAGTSATATLTTGGGTGEISTLRHLLLSIAAGSASTATGVQARITPPVALTGPIFVKLSPSSGSAGGLIFDNDPYWTVNYGADGKTVSSIDIAVATALTASTTYTLQVEVCEADASGAPASLPVVLSN